MIEPQLMTQAAFAKLHGVTPMSVSRWRRKGWLQLVGKLVDVDASNALLERRPRKRNGGVAKGLADNLATDDLEAAPDWSLAEATRRKEAATARLRELEFDEKSGRLVALEDVGRAIREQLAILRNRLLRIPSECAPGLAQLKGPAAIEGALRDVLYGAMTELSQELTRQEEKRFAP